MCIRDRMGTAKIRGNYSTGATQQRLTLGGGIVIAGFVVDIALASTNDFGTVTQFSLGYSL